MKFAILTLLTSLVIAGVAAWFSIAGLMTIFSASSIAIAVMAGSLEVGKLVSASWLYRNWKNTGVFLKTYLSLAVLLLMFITSMGIFGYLSRAHLEQTATMSVDYSLDLEILQSRVDAEQFKIDNLRNRIAGLNDVLTTSRNEDKNYVNRTQQAERAEINTDIDEALNNIQQLNEQMLPLKRDVAKIEAEIGPLKYIADLIYGDEAKDHFDEAVRWVIILIVFVFDPLAVAMLIAANQTLRRYGYNIEGDDNGSTANPPRGGSSGGSDSGEAVEIKPDESSNNIQRDTGAGAGDNLHLQQVGTTADNGDTPVQQDLGSVTQQDIDDIKKKRFNQLEKENKELKKILAKKPASIEVEKIVEVPVEVEKIVEKRIEVPVERVIVRTDTSKIEELTKDNNRLKNYVLTLQRDLEKKPTEIEVEKVVERVVNVPVEIEKVASNDLKEAARLLATSEMNKEDLTEEEIYNILMQSSEKDVRKRIGFWATPLPKADKDNDTNIRYIGKK